MAKVITTELQHSGASAANITLDSSKNVTCENNLTVDGATTLTGTVTGDNNTLSFRNKIINGSMQIRQRGTSFTANGYTLDRWSWNASNDGASAITHTTTAPPGFGNSLKVDTTTADTSIAAGQFAQLNYKLEAQNLQDFAFGTSSAKSITLSFWVRSNKTGDYNFAIRQIDNSSKQVSSVYTINSADTWEKKTFTYAGDTSGVIDNNSGQGLQISWNLAIGSTYTGGTARSTWTTYANADFGAGHSVNLMDNTANEWLLSGVQLEVGSTATDFEHIPYADELARCQRYCWVSTYISGAFLGMGTSWNSDSVGGVIHLPVPMRADPSITFSSGNDFESTMVFSNTDTLSGGMSRPYSSAPPFSEFGWRGINSGAFTTGQAVILRYKDGQTDGKITAEAEL